MRSTLVAQPIRRHARHALRLPVVVAAVFLAAVALPAPTDADQASQPSSPAAGQIATGSFHSCAIEAGAVRCWGYGGDGALGYGNTTTIGDDETPGAAGPVDARRRAHAVAIAAGNVHTCAILDDGTVRCWGFGGDGRLGYGNTSSIGDDETPARSRPRQPRRRPHREGDHRRRTATPARSSTTTPCAAGASASTAASATAASTASATTRRRALVARRTSAPGARLARSAPAARTPARCSTTARCAAGASAATGASGTASIDGHRRTPTTRPDDRRPGRPRRGPHGDGDHGGLRRTPASCSTTAPCAAGALGGDGRLGYGTQLDVGDDETPGMVDAGQRRREPHHDRDHRRARSHVRAAGRRQRALLGLRRLRPARLRHAEPGRRRRGARLARARSLGGAATAISAGRDHTCARLGDGSVRCWGRGSNGRLGACNEITIGDNELPTTAGLVALGQAGIARPESCLAFETPPPPPTSTAGCRRRAAAGGRPATPARSAPARPARGAGGRPARRGARRREGPRRAVEPVRAIREAQAHHRVAPGTPVRGRQAPPRAASGQRPPRAAAQRLRAALRARSRPRERARRGGDRQGRRTAELPGGRQRRHKAPAARRYVVKQSTRPIRTLADFNRAPSLCRGRCSFEELTSIKSMVTLEVTKLVRNRLYYYAVAARDNVSSRIGPRSRTVSVRAR